MAKELGVSHFFSTIEELIEKKSAEALVIATRTESHASIATTAIRAGLHVSYSDTPLLERVHRDGFRAAHFVRHRPLTLGDLFPEEHPIRMTMVHDLYVLGQMVKNEEPEMFDALDSIGPHGRATFTWATLRWKDGRVATLHSHWILPPGAPFDGWDRLEVFGNTYHAQVETNPQRIQWTQKKAEWPIGLEISSIEGPPVGILAEELRSFIGACKGGPVADGCRIQDAIQVQRWIESLMKSAELNHM